MHLLVKVKTGTNQGKIEPMLRSEIGGRADTFDKKLKLFKVELKNQPKNNKANKELIGILSNYFEVSKSEILIKSGGSSKLKLVEIK